MPMKNKILSYVFIIVIFYLIFQLLFNKSYEGYSINNEPCFDKPYIKYDNRYMCFDPKTQKEKTLSLFNHGQQLCEIVPNGHTMTLKDPLLDNLEYKQTTQQLCNPLEVSVK